MHKSYKKWLEEGRPKICCNCPNHEEIVITKNHGKRGIPKYIKGHQHRIHPIPKSYKKWLNNGKPKVYCQCGCNQEIIIKEYCKYYGIPEYIHGHYNKNKHFSNEHKQKISKSHFGKIVSLETKQKISDNAKVNKNYGMRNKHQTNIAKQKMSENHADISGRNNPIFKITKCLVYGKGSYYNSPLQGEIWLRSSYEIAYAKYLDSKNILWMYEMETFDLGNSTYTPDFYLPTSNLFVEIKGYMRKESQEKISKFLEQYPWDLEILRKEDLIKLGCEL